MRVHVRVIRGEWDPDAIGTSIGLEKFHIRYGNLIGHALRRAANPLIAVLVLNLVDKGIPAIRDLVFAGNLRHLGEVRFPGIRIPRIIVPQSAVFTGRQPEWESTGAGFGINVWSRAYDDV